MGQDSVFCSSSCESALSFYLHTCIHTLTHTDILSRGPAPYPESTQSQGNLNPEMFTTEPRTQQKNGQVPYATAQDFQCYPNCRLISLDSLVSRAQGQVLSGVVLIDVSIEDFMEVSVENS